MTEEKQDRHNEQKRELYKADREKLGAAYTSQPDRELARRASRVYSIRTKLAVVVSAYDCMEAFGGSPDGRGIGATLVSVLEACMDSLRREGHIPLRTDEDIASRFDEISGNFKKPTSVSLSMPSFARSTDIKRISEAVVEELEQKQEEEPKEEVTIETQDFTIGDVPDEEPLEDRIFQRTSDPLVKEVSESGELSYKEALIRTYRTLPESLWGTPTAKTLFNANLSLKEKNG